MQFRKSLHFWPKTVNFEKVYTSDPKQAISKKFTLLARKCPNRQSSHFWPQTLQNHQKYFLKIINTYFRIIKHVSCFIFHFFIFYNYHIWHSVHIIYSHWGQNSFAKKMCFFSYWYFVFLKRFLQPFLDLKNSKDCTHVCNLLNLSDLKKVAN